MALYTKVRHAPSVAEGILEEIEQSDNVKLLLTGWPGPLDPQALAENPVKVLLQQAHTNVAVLLDRGLGDVRRILVPVGGGPHSRLAMRLAYEIGRAGRAQVVALRVLNGHAQPDDEEVEDKTALLAEIIEETLGAVPSIFSLRVAQAKSVPEGILAEAAAEPYDLIVMGASEEWALSTRLFGSVDDWIADKAPCSVLLCRRYEPVAISWLRRQVKRMEHEYDQPAQAGPA